MKQTQTHLIERAAARLHQPLFTERAAEPQSQASDLRDAQAPAAGAPEMAPAGDRPCIEVAALKKAGLMHWTASLGRIAEEFRIIQAKLSRETFSLNGANVESTANLVMVTSAFKGEGKSFISLNLAGEIARQGDRRVLLIDADPKGGGLGELLGVSDEPGFLELVRESKVNPGEMIIPTAIGNLDVLPFGRNRERSAELLASRRMAEVVAAIGRHYRDRLVIFDAPPCLANSGPHALAAVVGRIILVVAANNTQRNDIAAALEMLSACPHVSLLLNKMSTWLAHSFGSYGNYAAAPA